MWVTRVVRDKSLFQLICLKFNKFINYVKSERGVVYDWLRTFFPSKHLNRPSAKRHLNATNAIGTASANSVESDNGCTSMVYFDNAGDNVTLTL